MSIQHSLIFPILRFIMKPLDLRSGRAQVGRLMLLSLGLEREVQ